jgi:hypothetical protein
MGVEHRNVIDICSIAPDGRAALTIVDDLPWLADTDHLVMLQNKLHDYLTGIESGQFFDAYPRARGRELEILVMCKYPPLPEAVRFLQSVREILGSDGIRFSWQVLEPA